MSVDILIGDVFDRLREMPDNSVDVVVTSPPYWGLRNYNVEGQIGLEPTLAEHIAVMVALFEDVRRVLKPTGALYLNYGDCYATTPNGTSAADCKATGLDDRTFRDKPFSTVGPVYGALPGEPHNPANGTGRRGGGNAPAGGYLKNKDLCMIPNRLAIALQDAGWWVRSEIIWGKPNPMPDSSGAYRPSSAHEKIFMLTKSGDADVWRARDSGEISFAPDLAERCPLITDPTRDGPRWLRIGSYYDAEAVRLPAAASSVARYDQDIEQQAGSLRANGGRKANGPMKAVGGPTRIKMPDGWHTAPGAHGTVHPAGREKGRTIDKQRGHSRRHAGFNERWDAMSREEQGANGRLLRNYEPAPLTVWPMATRPFSDAHFATFPPELVERCLRAGCPPGGLVLDPFGGAGTTGLVAQALGFDCILIELNPDYAEIARKRIEAARSGPVTRAALRPQSDDFGPLFRGS